MFRVILLVSLIFNGCSPIRHTHGKLLEQEDIAKIGKGTSKQEVLTLFGSPTCENLFEGNTWHYISQVRSRQAFFAPTIEKQNVITITFDNNDRVTEINLKDKGDARKIQCVRRVTKTGGQKTSLAEQIFGNFGRMNRKGDGPRPR